MQEETDAVEYEQTKTETNLEAKTKARNERAANLEQNGELRFHGVRGVITNPFSMCDKLDKMFGSGAEAIVHYMWFESGRDIFDNMLKNNQSKSPEELLRTLVDLQPACGWGCLSLKIIRLDPPLADITVKNPPVKTLKGSQKQMVGSFWAGVLSRYFNRQLTSKNFGYNADKDEFSCTITV